MERRKTGARRGTDEGSGAGKLRGRCRRIPAAGRDRWRVGKMERSRCRPIQREEVEARQIRKRREEGGRVFDERRG